jgi:HEAT repeat protein
VEKNRETPKDPTVIHRLTDKTCVFSPNRDARFLECGNFSNWIASNSLWRNTLTMAKTRGVEAKLARLYLLRKEPISPAVVGELRKFLGDSSNFVVAEAAAIAGEGKGAELAQDLIAAFDRFMDDPAETDKLCRAKNAILEALNKLDYDRAEIFLRGIQHIQMEPGWPRGQDTASALRGTAAFGLVRLGYRGILILLADLLADSEKVARVAAVQALGATGSMAAIPLLRFKTRLGDKEPEVIWECFTALLQLEPESVEFVGEFLHAGDEAIGEGAALALGEARRPEAFESLRSRLTTLRSGSLQDAVLLAISMLRLPAAIDFLIEQIAVKAIASAALVALAIHRHNDQIKQRVAAAVAQSQDPALQTRFDEKFNRR